MLRASPRVHAHELFNLLGDRQKRDVGLFEVQRLPTAHLLPIVARTGFGISVKKPASDKIRHSSWRGENKKRDGEGCRYNFRRLGSRKVSQAMNGRYCTRRADGHAATGAPSVAKNFRRPM